MSSIFPEYISPDGLQFVFALAYEETVTYICSSTKLRNAIAEVLNEKLRPAPDSAQHYKEAAEAIIKSIKTVTGETLNAVTFENAEGKFLTISPTYFQHNFPPTREEDEVIINPSDGAAKMTKRQAEIRARLEKLAL